MNERIITVDDIMLIELLIKTSNSINNLYQKLIDLDITGNKNSEEYKKIVDYLKIAISRENDIYENSKIDAKKASELVSFIIETRIYNKIYDDIESVMVDKCEYSSIRRIINILNSKVKKETDLFGVFDTYCEYEKEYISDLQNTLYLTNVVEDNLKLDLLSGIITFNEEEINLSKDSFEKKDLIKMKYAFSYINKELEEDLLKCFFTPYNISSNNVKLISLTMNISDELVSNVKRNYLTKIAIKEIYKLLSNENNKSLLRRKSVIRSIFMLMDDETLGDINDFFNQIVMNNAYLNKLDNSDSKKIIEKCFINTYIDKNKQMILKI